MAETPQDIVERELREFKRYTGDGLPGEPVNAPLPVGDPQSGVHNPKKKNLREALLAPLQAGDIAVQAAARAEEAAEEADNSADRAEAAASGVEYPVSYGLLQPLTDVQRAQAQQNIRSPFVSVSDLLADEMLAYAPAAGKVMVSPGDIIEAQGFRYEVAASGAVDWHVETAGGVKLYVLGDVTPVNALGADHTGAVSSLEQFQKARDIGKPIVLRGEYSWDGGLISTAGVHLIVEIDSSITLTEPATNVVRSTDFLRVEGARLIVDGSGLCSGAGFAPENTMPEIENVTFRNIDDAALLNIGADGSVSPTSLTRTVGYAKNCRAENCGRGFLAYGVSTGAVSPFRFVGEFKLIDSSTDEDCGAAGNIYFFSTIRRAEVIGGKWFGVNTTGGNCYQCDESWQVNNEYHGLLRGACTGKNSRNFHMIDNKAFGCVYTSFQADLRDDAVPPETLEYPYSWSIMRGNISRGSLGWDAYLQGKGILYEGNVSEGTGGVASVRTNGADAVLIQGNLARGLTGGSKLFIQLGNASKVRVGPNDTDCEATYAYNTADGENSLIEFLVSPQRQITATGSGNFNIPGDVGTVICNGSGTLSMRLPDMDSSNVRRQWTFIQASTTQTVAINVLNGDGTIIGTTSLSASDTGKSIVVTAYGFKQFAASKAA